ncbi:MAG TPA: hypothetical protein VD970_16095 [Acetobacteraceae bacterium]|nr:hypothetical protein [Acetobacteraceae bacterium]
MNSSQGEGRASLALPFHARDLPLPLPGLTPVGSGEPLGSPAGARGQSPRTTSSHRRILALHLPRLATDRLRRAGPLAVWAAEAGRRVVTAVDVQAAEAGLFAGQALADAQAVLPGVALVPADPEEDAAFQERLALWAMRFTPLVGVEGADGLLLDVTGCAHLFGGEAALLGEVAGRLERQGVAVCAALAGAPLAALALARAGVGGVVAEGDEAAAVSPLPLSAIGLEPAMAARLHALGLRSVGAVMAQPRAGLVRRFGVALAARLNEVAGVAARPIRPVRPPSEFVAVRAFAEPIATREAVEAALEGVAGAEKPPPRPSHAGNGRGDPLPRVRKKGWTYRAQPGSGAEAGQGGSLPIGTPPPGGLSETGAAPPGLLPTIVAQLRAAGRGARRIVLRADRVDGVVQRIAIGTGLATRDVQHLRRLLRERLERLEPDCGYDRLALEVTESEPLGTEQAGLGVTGRPVQRQALAELLDRLAQRLAVWRLAPRASHWPERAVVRVSPFEAVTAEGWAARPRPVRLLRRPEPVQAVALLPDAPPSLLQLGRVSWRVTRAEGPERLEPEWWRDRPDRRFRDYYRVELASGARLWVCRVGFAAPGEAARWYLHGRFG